MKISFGKGHLKTCRYRHKPETDLGPEGVTVLGAPGGGHLPLDRTAARRAGGWGGGLAPLSG